MTRYEFMKALEASLSRMNQKDRDETLSYYGELIDDMAENGKTEEEAVASLGGLDDIVRQILAETGDTTVGNPAVDSPAAGSLDAAYGAERAEAPKENAHSGGGFAILLLILGFPLWFPLLIAFAAVVFALYVTIWAVTFALWTVDLSLALSGIMSIFFGISSILINPAQVAAGIGAGCLLCSLALILLLALLRLTKFFAHFSSVLFSSVCRRIKSFFVKEG